MSNLSIRMYQHFRVPLDPLIEFLVCRRCFVDIDLVTDDKAGICFPRDDHVAKIAVVFLDVTLAGA